MFTSQSYHILYIFIANSTYNTRHESQFGNEMKNLLLFPHFLLHKMLYKSFYAFKASNLISSSDNHPIFSIFFKENI
jgi:hypothetical protein